MKKILAAFAVLSCFAFGVIDWKPVNLDHRVTVSFPGEPETKEMSGNPVWIKDVENGNRCMTMIIDFAKYGMDSAALAKEMSAEKSFDDFKEGVLGQIENSKLISEKKTTVKGKMSFEFVINMGHDNDPEALNIMHSRNIFVGDRMYTLSFFEKTGKPDDVNRNKFFNSFLLK